MQNSVFCRLILQICCILQESVILNRCIFWLRRLYEIVQESVIYRWILTALCAIGTVLRGCIFGRMLCRDGCVDGYTGESALYRKTGRLWGRFKSLCGTIGKGLGRVNSGSLNEKLYRKTLGRFSTETVIGAVIFLIFIVPHANWNNLYALVLAGFLAVLYFCRSFGNADACGQEGTAGLWFPLLFFMISVFAGVPASLAVGDSVRILLFFITAFLLCIVIWKTCSSYRKIDILLRGVVLSLIVTGVYAIVQWIMGVEVDILLADMNLNKNMPGRAFGTLGNPNNFAEFLMLFIPFALAFTMNQEKGGWKTVGFAAVALGTVALILTYSRSGWIAFATAAVVFAALYDKKYLPVLVLAALVCIPLLPETVLDRILTIGNLEDTSSSYRLDIWAGSLDMLRDGYWFSGTGLGAEAFTSVYPAYGLSGATAAPHTHMQFMEMLAELGILGMVSLLWYSISLTRRTALAATGGTSGKVKSVLCAAAASVAGITAIGFAEYTWFYPRVMLAFFIVAGIAMAAVYVAKREGQEK